MGPNGNSRLPRRSGRGNGRRGRMPGGSRAAPSNDVAVPRPLRAWRTTRSFMTGPFLPVATDYGRSLVVALNALPDYLEFEPLFQQYRLLRAAHEVTFLPGIADRYSPVVWCGRICGAAVVAPTSLNEVMQLAGNRKFAFGPDKRTFRVSYVPMCRTSDATALTRYSPWCSMRIYPDHFGAHLWFQGFNTIQSAGAEIYISCTMTFELRGDK